MTHLYVRIRTCTTTDGRVRQRARLVGFGGGCCSDRRGEGAPSLASPPSRKAASAERGTRGSDVAAIAGRQARRRVRQRVGHAGLGCRSDRREAGLPSRKAASDSATGGRQARCRVRQRARHAGLAGSEATASLRQERRRRGHGSHG